MHKRGLLQNVVWILLVWRFIVPLCPSSHQYFQRSIYRSF